MLSVMVRFSFVVDFGAAINVAQCIAGFVFPFDPPVCGSAKYNCGRIAGRREQIVLSENVFVVPQVDLDILGGWR